MDIDPPAPKQRQRERDMFAFMRGISASETPILDHLNRYGPNPIGYEDSASKRARRALWWPIYRVLWRANGAVASATHWAWDRWHRAAARPIYAPGAFPQTIRWGDGEREAVGDFVVYGDEDEGESWDDEA